jgi:hypothetical protein
MKLICAILMSVICLHLTTSLKSQTGVSISEAGDLPDGSAILDLQSVSKGFLPPRMTTSERNGIASPAVGLMVYNTDLSCLELHAGNNVWNCMGGSTPCASNLTIGQVHEGGILIHLFPGEGCHGLVMTPSNQGTATWGCSSTQITYTGAGIGDGWYNTAAIVAQCNEASFAAKVCANLSVNGFDDWYLPSQQELYLLRGIHGGGVSTGFGSNFYWSSTQLSASGAYVERLSDGGLGNDSKANTRSVRCIRKF